MLEKFATLKEKHFYLFCFFLFICNLIVTANVELSFDEAYYWMYSQNLDWGYFDHPPAVALMIKMGTLIWGNSEIGVRFFANILTICSYLILFKIIEKKNISYFLISILSMPLVLFSGLFALPDTPLLFFTVTFFYFVKRYIDSDSVLNAIFIAISIAGIFFSKYYGILIVLLTVLANMSFLKRKSFWLIILMVCIFFLPHVYWQYKNDFVSFKFHLFGRKEKHFSFSNISNYVTSQIALLGFFNLFLMIYLFMKNKFRKPFERIMVFNSIGFLGFLFFLSFRNQIEANWTASVAISLIILFSGLIVDKYKKYYFLFSILPIGLVTTLYIGIGSLTFFEKDLMSKESRINEIIGWKSERIPKILEECGDRRIIADTYQVASKVGFYTNKVVPALHINSRESQYSLWNYKKNIAPDERVCYLTTNTRRIPGIRIESGYKDPIIVIKDISLDEIAMAHGLSYEEITREYKL